MNERTGDPLLTHPPDLALKHTPDVNAGRWVMKSATLAVGRQNPGTDMAAQIT